MLIEFSGLSTKLKKACSFNFKLDLDKVSIDDFYFTFENIYLVTRNDNEFSTIKNSFIFNFESKIFNQLNSLGSNVQKDHLILSVCSNTNHFWCLVFGKNNFYLLQYSGGEIVNEFYLNEINFNNKNDLFIVSTDINCYIFEQNKLSYELQCRFELKTTKSLNSTMQENEAKLNENATSSLKIDTVLFAEQIKQVSCGKEHVLMLTSTNRIYSFGIGSKGQLGHQKIENCFEPNVITALQEINIKLIATGNRQVLINLIKNDSIFLNHNYLNNLIRKN
jgi:alpha-tubulin suppressor-like RCC1 family protein